MTTTVNAKLSFTLKFGKQEYPCRAADLALRGVFLLTDARPREHQLVRIAVVLPAREELLVHGMVERVVGYEEAEKEGLPAGVSVRFYGLGVEIRTKWEALVASWKAAVSDEERAEHGAGEPSDVEEDTAPPADTKPADLDWDSSALLEPEDAGEASDETDEGDEAPAEPVEQRPCEQSAAELDEEHAAAPAPSAESEESDEQPTGVFSPVRRVAPTGAADPHAKRAAAPWLRDASMLLRAREGSTPSATSNASDRGGLASWFGPRAHSAPADTVGHVVYRLVMPSVEALQGFASTALKSGGVFVRSSDRRAPGTPAVVCIVHPVDQREFHLPGTVRPSVGRSPGVAVKFDEVTTRTIALFHLFIRPQNVQGLPPGPPTEKEGLEEELSLVAVPAVPVEGGGGVRLDENTQELRVSDLASLVGSLSEEEDEPT